MQPIPCDAIMFDMDGTLWDAVDSYAKVWDDTFNELGIRHDPVTRGDLINLMGRHLEDIMSILCGGIEIPKRFVEVLDENEKRVMPTLGGRLYPGVTETIRELSQRYKLFMVSNCGVYGLENFLEFTHLKPYFTGWLSHGETGLEKSANITLLAERFKLKAPVYVGDTVTDARAAAEAGIPMIWCKYGFGHVDDDMYSAAIDSITELPDVIKPL